MRMHGPTMLYLIEFINVRNILMQKGGTKKGDINAEVLVCEPPFEGKNGRGNEIYQEGVGREGSISRGRIRNKAGGTVLS